MKTRKCYFFNVGTTFDKNNLSKLDAVWNCNSNCCKSDLCNGLYCEDYGIQFDKDETIKYIKEYVKDGVVSTYGFIKSVDITLDEEIWDDIYNNLVENYSYRNKKIAKNKGFISFDFGEIIDDFSSYWEEPDVSFLKTDNNEIVKNKIHILKEKELNQDVIKWVNKYLYGKTNDELENEIEEEMIL